MNSVVTFTLFQRPFYTRQVLEAWKQVRGVEDWEFHFHIEAGPQADAQFAVVKDFAVWHPDAVTICEHQKRLGVLHNPHHAMELAFEWGSDYTVLAEEDVIPGDDALEFFGFAKTVDSLAACAWSDADGPENEAEGRRWFNPWLWGCSEDSWQETISPTWDFDYSSGDERGPGGWDCNLGLRVVHDHDQLVLFPKASRSEHIGQWLGVHQDPRAFGETERPASFKEHRDPVTWVINQSREAVRST